MHERKRPWLLLMDTMLLAAVITMAVYTVVLRGRVRRLRREVDEAAVMVKNAQDHVTQAEELTDRTLKLVEHWQNEALQCQHERSLPPAGATEVH